MIVGVGGQGTLLTSRILGKLAIGAGFDVKLSEVQDVYKRQVWSREELTRMEDICMANNTLLVSDEIHSDLVFHGKKHIPTATLSAETAGRVISCISGTKTFNLAGLQASTTIFPNLEMKKKFDDFWMAMDVHRNNAFSSVAMEVAFNEGEEWLEQLLAYLDGNFTFIREYCSTNIPKIKPTVPDATYLAVSYTHLDVYKRQHVYRKSDTGYSGKWQGWPIIRNGRWINVLKSFRIKLYREKWVISAMTFFWRGLLSGNGSDWPWGFRTAARRNMRRFRIT